jgi:hypothetical protein
MEITVTRVGKGVENVGRPTPLGNPYYMASESQRDKVCDQYQRWFDNKVEAKDPAVLGELRRLWRVGKEQGYLKLGCYCAPRRCHADTIASFLKSHL